VSPEEAFQNYAELVRGITGRSMAAGPVQAREWLERHRSMVYSHELALESSRAGAGRDGIVRRLGLHRAELERLEAWFAELEERAGPELELLVVIPCGGAKLSHRAPAGELYVGNYHRAARRAAERLVEGTGGRVVILSALHGFVDPTTELEPYELRIGDSGAVGAAELYATATELGIYPARRVVILAGAAYADAAALVYPYAERPLAGTRGIGDQLARLKRIALRPELEERAR
jgi:hypothetical protein